MTRTSEGLAAFVVDQLEELYRRMWVLRLLDMALEQLRIEGLINGPLQGFVGAAHPPDGRVGHDVVEELQVVVAGNAEDLRDAEFGEPVE